MRGSRSPLRTILRLELLSGLLHQQIRSELFDRYNITSEDDLREAMQRTSDYVSTQATRSTVTPIRPVAAAGVAP